MLTLAIIAWRREVLRWPPYWDCAIGLWTEANYLAETNFDYRSLWYEENSVWQGGARSYATSLLPTLLALGMRTLPSTETLILVTHVLSMAFGAGVLLLFFRLALDVTSGPAAAAATAAIATTPLFRVQLDMLGMELPMLLFVLLAAHALFRHRYRIATCWAVAAFLMKPTGGLMTLAGLAFAAANWISQRSDREATIATARHRGGAIMLGALWIAQWTVLRWGGAIDALMESRYRHPMATLPAAVFWCPDIVVVFIVATVLSLLLWRRTRPNASVGSSHVERRDGSTAWQSAGRFFATIVTWLAARPMLLLSWLLVLGLIAAIYRICFLPRYLVIAIPFLYLIVLIGWSRNGRSPRGAVAVLSVIVVLNLFNARGRFFPSLAVYPGAALARTGALLERSGEYLADHRANLRAVATLVREAPDEPIIASRPHLDFLAMPRLGYVAAPLHGLAVGSYSDLLSDRFPTITETSTPWPTRPVLVYIDNTWSRLSAVLDIPPPSDEDEVLYRDDLDPPLIVYRKGWPQTAPRRDDVDDWYLDRLWPHARPTDRRLYRVAWYVRHNRPDDAWREARLAVAEHPYDFFLRQWLFDLSLARGDLELAVHAMSGCLPEHIARTRAAYAPTVERGVGPLLGDILPPPSVKLADADGWPLHFEELKPSLLRLREGDADGALVAADAMAGKPGDSLSATVFKACMRLELGFPKKSLSLLEAVLADAPTNGDRTHAGALNVGSQSDELLATSWYIAARAYLALGQLSAAHEAAETLGEAHPSDPRAWRIRAYVHWRRGDMAAAIADFERAQALEPADPTVAEALAFLRGDHELERPRPESLPASSRMPASHPSASLLPGAAHQEGRP